MFIMIIAATGFNIADRERSSGRGSGCDFDRRRRIERRVDESELRRFCLRVLSIVQIRRISFFVISLILMTALFATVCVVTHLIDYK
jgi:hypothetical protein